MPSVKVIKLLVAHDLKSAALDAEIAARAARGDAMPSGEQAERINELLQWFIGQQEEDPEIAAAARRGCEAVQAYADALDRSFASVAQDDLITNEEIANFTGASEQEIALV